MVPLILFLAVVVGCVLVRLLLTPVDEPALVRVESDEAYGKRLASAGYHAGGRR